MSSGERIERAKRFLPKEGGICIKYITFVFPEVTFSVEANNRSNASGPALRDIFLFVPTCGKYFCYYLMFPLERGSCFRRGSEFPIQNWVNNPSIIDSRSFVPLLYPVEYLFNNSTVRFCFPFLFVTHTYL